MLEARFNHIAFLVPSVRATVGSNELKAFPIGPAEKWEGEGTLEIYVGPENSVGRLLLMEPVTDGAYRRAIEKRGPGLHHVAIDVLDLEAYVSYLSGTGWLLHPRSLETMKATRTVWLARPGIPMLVEIQERTEFSAAPKFIEKVCLPLSPEQIRIVNALKAHALVQSPDNGLHLWVGGAFEINAELLLA